MPGAPRRSRKEVSTIVHSLERRFRSLLLALAVLALSAGVALAGRGSHPIATSEPAGPTSQNENAGGDVDESEAPESEAPESEAPDTGTPDAGTPDATTPDAGAPAGQHPDNHGKTVSEAAQAVTPAGFANHGAWVSSIAKQNHGHDTAGAATAGAHGKSKNK
jgi:hypothetical protein